jgi:hypothetical protein
MCNKAVVFAGRGDVLFQERMQARYFTETYHAQSNKFDRWSQQIVCRSQEKTLISWQRLVCCATIHGRGLSLQSLVYMPARATEGCLA